MIRHFLDLHEIPASDLQHIIDAAVELKKASKAGTRSKPLDGNKLAMIFEKTSLRTRVSFEVGMFELGGHALYLNSNDLQLDRGETVADTAKVLSRYVDAIMLRCHDHARLLELAAHATVPVINGLSNLSHPCQIMADIMTYQENRGSLEGKTVAWIGDGSNVGNSVISAAAKFGFALRLANPALLQPNTVYLKDAIKAGADIQSFDTANEAAKNADIVMTDIWVSMGFEHETDRHKILAPYQVNASIMAAAASDAMFMHCLPAHRGEEVTADVIDGPNSVVWDEAENRLHVQKAILLWCFGKLE